MTNTTHTSRPLDGITVISLEQAIAAPLCTRQLADLGARVVKIERPGTGDFARSYDSRVRGLSSHFVWTNRSKESLTLNLKHEQAAPILGKLLAKADVLVQNLAPGAAARLGLAYNDLCERFPKLIVCNISGYGDYGPYTDKKAYDLLIQSEGGVLSTTGGPGRNEMAKVGCSIADISAGMYAQSSIMAALIQRESTGRGTSIDVSMLESIVEWMGYPMYYAIEGQPQPPRAGASHSTIFPYGPFATGDGKSVMLGLQNEREWQTFCEHVLKQPELAKDPRFITNSDRSTNRESLTALIHASFADLTVEQATVRLDEAKIANAHVNHMVDVWKHPQLEARGRWCTIGSPEGELPALMPPGINRDFDPRMDAVPGLGEHTSMILTELGYTPASIEELSVEEVV